MKEVLFTGLTRAKKTPKSICCYLCKRKERDGTLIAINGKAHDKRLELHRVSFGNPNGLYKVIMCVECLLLIGAFANQEESRLTVE